MRKIIVLVCMLFTAGPSSANRAVEQCSAASTTDTVKEIIFEHALPSTAKQRIPIQVLMNGTSIKDVSPIRYDTELKIAECFGIFTVDASAGVDPDAARAIEVNYARAPDLLLMLQLLLSQPPKGRVYDFEIVYSSQIVDGSQNYVSVGPVNDFKALVTAGLLLAQAGTTTQRKSMAEPDLIDLANLEFIEADKEMGTAYSKAMAAAGVDEKAKLESEQVNWILQRDAACSQVSSDLESIACATKHTINRANQLTKQTQKM